VIDRVAVLGAVAAVIVAVACASQGNPKPSVPRVEPAARTAAGAPERVLFTGSDDGYLDACGCDDGLLGGLPRRHTLLRRLGSEGDGALVLSNGRLVAGSSPLDQMKFDAILLAMATMGYDGIALTERELALGRARIAEMAEFLGDDCPFLATNLVDAARPGARAGKVAQPLPCARALVRNVAGREIVVLAAVAASRGDLYRTADPDVRVADPERALREEIARHEKAWKVVVLGQMSLEEAEALARATGRIDLLIVQGPDYDDHPQEGALRAGTTTIVTTGRKGKFVGSFRFGGAGEPDRFEPEPVEDTILKSSDVQDVVIRTYRDPLLENSPRPIEAYFERTPTKSGAEYVGADEGSCAGCHPKAWETWATSRHSRAWKTLVDQDLPPAPDDRKGRLKNAIWDPDCVKCHVTGFGEVSGYAGIEKEALRPEAPLVNVTCEACHGPAGDHAERASRGDPSWPGAHAPHVPGEADFAADPAKAQRDFAAAEALCMRCHDPDNSPVFELRPYWKGLVRGEQREAVAHGRE